MSRRMALMLLVLALGFLGMRNEAMAAPIKVAVVTGGHDFDEKPFLSLFEGYPDVDFVYLPQKDDSEIFENTENWPYDVVVLYNMTQNISPARRAHFEALLDRGVGVVALHHVMGAFNDWPEFQKIIGARYRLKEETIGATKVPGSTYKHGVTIPVHVEDAAHPVTAGVSDFEVEDETYKGSDFEADNHVLLTTDEPTSDKTIGWVRTCRKARVCCLQLGHGPGIFAEPNYRRLAVQAIRWTARRS